MAIQNLFHPNGIGQIELLQGKIYDVMTKLCGISAIIAESQFLRLTTLQIVLTDLSVILLLKLKTQICIQQK